MSLSPVAKSMSQPVAKSVAWIASLLLFVGGFYTSPGQAGDAAVASPEPLATAVAVEVLERGGNAVDAAVAVAFTLAVTLPDAGNIGGGGFMTLSMNGATAFLDYRETAPAAAHRDLYLDANGDVMSEASLTGHRAVGTPGTVAGLWAAHQRYGSLPWASLVAPAIALARDGFDTPAWLVSYAEDVRERFSGTTNFERYFGELRAGELFAQPELARTLEHIASHGQDGFYRGAVADAIVAEMERGDGLITAEDLADYKPVWRRPLSAAWRDYELVTAPLPSSGGFAIIQFLKMRDLLTSAFAGLAHNSPQYLHLKAELEKRIFADRARYLGDPDFVDVPLRSLLTENYLRERIATVNPIEPSITESVRGGLEPRHTTHFSILDFDGNAVSNTYTLNTDFGSGVVVTGAGFLLNNEMDDFSAAPGQPNYYGVVGDEANAIAPNKRMLSSMAPTILRRDGKVAMVVGAMGGSTIFTTVYQVIVNLEDYAMDPRDALAATRVHHQLYPVNTITYSPTTPLPEATVAALQERGYVVVPHDWEFGNVQLITVDAEGTVRAASDHRFEGRASVLAR